MNKSAILLLFAACLTPATLKAQGHVDGYVVDAANGETLPSAFLRMARSDARTVSNGYGFFSLPSSSVQDTVVVSYLGYETLTMPLSAGPHANIRLALKPIVRTLNEVTVNAPGSYKAELQTPAMSHHRLSNSELTRTVMMFGEPDVLKSLQLMPGVNAAADGSNNLSVRGGSHDQNLILLDEAIVFNPSHAMGVVSAFNPDAILDVNFYKGAIPARYGGRLSAVVDMRMREGDNKAYKIRGGVGTVCSRLMIEGPIKNDKASFIASARRGYAYIVNKVQSIFDYRDYDPAKNDASFGDYTAKVNWKISDNDRLFASAYVGHDAFNYSFVMSGTDTKWSNKTATVRWNHLFSPTLFANTTVTASMYDYGQEQKGDALDCEWTAKMSEIDAKIDVDHYVAWSRLQYGLGIEAHRYEPGKISPTSRQSSVREVEMTKRRMGLGYAYVGANREVGRFQMSLGLRLSVAPQIGPATVFNYADADRTVATDSTTYGHGEFVKTYFAAEPRIGLSFVCSDFLTLKASYSRTKQFQHLLTNSALSLPTDIWTPADSYAPPQLSDAVALGVHSFIEPLGVEASAEVYMKWLDNVIDFKDGADLKMNEHYETQLLSGFGYAKGLEILIRKEAPRYAFSLAYTLSEAKRKIDGVNGGEWYYARYDQRHNVSLSALFRPTDRLDLSAVFRYHTGGRTTLPEQTFFYMGVRYCNYTERNGYEMPAYHRLDVSATLKLDEHKHWEHSLVFALANVYGRKNVYSMYTKGDLWERSDLRLYKMYLYRWMPSVTYVFCFK